MRRDPVQSWMKHHSLMLFSLCLVFGMVAGFQNAVLWWIWAAGLVLSVGIGLIRRRPVFLFASAMLLGALIMTLALIRPSVSEQEDILLTGRIVSEPQRSNASTRVLLSEACADGEALPSRVMLYLYGSEAIGPELQYGQMISVSANTHLPSDRINPYSSSYSAYLWRQGAALTATGSLANLSITAQATPSLTGWMISRRAAFQETIVSLYSDETAALVSALLLGDRSLLSDEITESFRAAGISHLLAISGLHIACLAVFLDWILRRLRCPEQLVFLLISLFLTAYSALVGFSSSVARASLMYIFSSGARIFGRPSHGFTGLTLALLLILIVRPLALTDASLILSFSSVFGLMAITRLLAPRRPLRLHGVWRTPLRRIGAALSASLAAQLGALPASIYFFDSLSLYSLLANLPAIPLMTLSLPVAMASVAVGSFSVAAGKIISLPVEWTFRALVSFSNWIASLPGALIYFPRWPAVLLVLYTVVLFCCAPFSKLRLSLKRLCIVLLPIIAVSSLFLPGMRSESNLEITFLDVGQADAAVIRAEDRYYLIDVGQDGSVADYLAASGIQPAGIFLSHPHSDHVGGLSDIIECCSPSVIYTPCLWNDVDADDGVPELLSLAVEAGWSVCPLKAGDAVALSDLVSANILQPWPLMTDDANGVSLVIHLTFGEASALFTGDLPSEYECVFFPDCDLLKVAHHGSKSSTSSLFLSMTSPSAAVVSVGRNNYGHPSPETMNRLEQAGAAIYRTDENGAVTFLLKPDGSLEITPMINLESEEAA